MLSNCGLFKYKLDWEPRYTLTRFSDSHHTSITTKRIYSASALKSQEDGLVINWPSTDSLYPCLELVSLAWDMKLDRERVPKPRHPVSLFIGFPTTPDSIAPPVPCFAPLTPPEKEGMDFFSPHSDLLQIESKTNRPGFSIIPTLFHHLSANNAREYHSFDPHNAVCWWSVRMVVFTFHNGNDFVCTKHNFVCCI